MRKFHILSKNLRTPNEVRGNNRLTAVIAYTLIISRFLLIFIKELSYRQLLIYASCTYKFIRFVNSFCTLWVDLTNAYTI